LAERSPGFCPSKRCKWSQLVSSMSPPKKHPLVAFSRTSKNISKASSAVLVKHNHYGFCVWFVILSVTLYGIQRFGCSIVLTQRKHPFMPLDRVQSISWGLVFVSEFPWTCLLESLDQQNSKSFDETEARLSSIRRKSGGSKEFWSPKTTKNLRVRRAKRSFHRI
jgi:hypothetical protein